MTPFNEQGNEASGGAWQRPDSKSHSAPSTWNLPRGSQVRTWFEPGPTTGSRAPERRVTAAPSPLKGELNVHNVHNGLPRLLGLRGQEPLRETSGNAHLLTDADAANAAPFSWHWAQPRQLPTSALLPRIPGRVFSSPAPAAKSANHLSENLPYLRPISACQSWQVQHLPSFPLKRALCATTRRLTARPPAGSLSRKGEANRGPRWCGDPRDWPRRARRSDPAHPSLDIRVGGSGDWFPADTKEA